MAVKTVQSLSTGLRVLELVSEYQPVGVRELARTMGVDKSVVHRALVTLHADGWIRPEGTDPVRWVLTGRALSVGSAFSARHSASEVGHRLIRELHRATRETVLLSVRDGRRFLVVDIVESTQPLKITFPVGHSVELEAQSAAGQALLSQLPADEVAAIVGTEASTAHRGRLAQVRRRGYAVQTERGNPLWAVAAPLRAGSPDAVAVVVIAVPRQRCTRAALDALGELLREATETAR